MKKLLLFLFACVSLLVGCSNGGTYEEISFNDYKEMINNKESFILFIGSTQCSHCASFKKTINKVVSDYDVKVYYIDIYNFSEKESKEFDGMIKFTGTPTTVFYNEGVEEHPSYNRINGNKPYSKVVEMFTKNGYIKE